ncbi:hypothetical protein [Methylomonas albis]|nr:hypothetical protein [Methylomonas albis]
MLLTDTGDPEAKRFRPNSDFSLAGNTNPVYSKSATFRPALQALQYWYDSK